MVKFEKELSVPVRPLTTTLKERRPLHLAINKKLGPQIWKIV